ncbi:hypothetical protein HMPREF3214_00946 [Alloscardovia omnicolens]|nr:hypothetical protein HMPREF3214_00946 [Alloscardovia omnicolens]
MGEEGFVVVVLWQGLHVLRCAKATALSCVLTFTREIVCKTYHEKLTM